MEDITWYVERLTGSYEHPYTLNGMPLLKLGPKAFVAHANSDGAAGALRAGSLLCMFA
jgi:hypothetical protein